MKKILAIILAFSSISASAAEDGFNFLASGGLTSGGDTLAEVTNGGGTLKAGGLFYFAFGTAYQFAESPFQLQASVGYHFDTISADDGSADFGRVFFEVMPFYKINDNIRAGLGITGVLSADYSDPFDDLEFDNPIGLTAEVGFNWGLPNGSWWGLRYVDMEYTIESINGIDISQFNITVDGSYVGLMFHGVF